MFEYIEFEIMIKKTQYTHNCDNSNNKYNMFSDKLHTKIPAS